MGALLGCSWLLVFRCLGFGRGLVRLVFLLGGFGCDLVIRFDDWCCIGCFVRRFRHALGKVHRDGVAFLGYHHACEIVQQLLQLVGAVVAHVEIGVALLQAAAHFAQPRVLPVVLVIGDDGNHGFLDALFRDGGGGGVHGPARLVGRVSFVGGDVFHQQLQGGEDVARLAEGKRGLLLAHADDGQAAFADARGQAGEVAVRRHDAEPVHLTGVEDIHGVDDHGVVGCVLAFGIAELLDGRDGVVQ